MSYNADIVYDFEILRGAGFGEAKAEELLTSVRHLTGLDCGLVDTGEKGLVQALEEEAQHLPAFITVNSCEHTFTFHPKEKFSKEIKEFWKERKDYIINGIGMGREDCHGINWRAGRTHIGAGAIYVAFGKYPARFSDFLAHTLDRVGNEDLVVRIHKAYRIVI